LKDSGASDGPTVIHHTLWHQRCYHQQDDQYMWASPGFHGGENERTFSHEWMYVQWITWR
jgi:hypothetical protein